MIPLPFSLTSRKHLILLIDHCYVSHYQWVFYCKVTPTKSCIKVNSHKTHFFDINS